MLLFLGITYLEGQAPQYYVAIYVAKVAVVSYALFLCRSTFRDIKWEPKWILPSVLIGGVLAAIWIGVEKNVAYPHFFGSRSAFNPFDEIQKEPLRWAFIVIRM